MATRRNGIIVAGIGLAIIAVFVVVVVLPNASKAPSNAQPSGSINGKEATAAAMPKPERTSVSVSPKASDDYASLSFIAFFEWDHSDLSGESLGTIKQAARTFLRDQVSQPPKLHRMIVTGFTDASQPAPYNMALSLRRANAVKAALVKEGVSASLISVIGKGQNQPRIPTEDGIREPQNRRVEIKLE